MKEYQISARRYRPQLFKEVIGQDPIVKTLKNSIKKNKTAQAYLFCGPKGIGKTTLTRLLAKALNCKELKKDQEPCNKCVSCKEITAGSSLEVIEIDGASNRGIEDIRKINETIGYSPTSGKYKIYIIDEVHMLTKEAFNALLKTLEEPPSTIKFFFATTEPNKILPTIISRCQKFDLKPIIKSLIVKKLENIAKDQKRIIFQDALNLISKFSEGSLRDAESILDQALSYTENDIEAEDISKMLGLIPQDYFFKLDEAVKTSNLSFAFEFIESLKNEGKDLYFFLEELIEHFRKILIFKLKKTSLFLSDEITKKYLISEKIYSLDQSFYILDLLIHSMKTFHQTISKKVFLEFLILKILQSKNRISIQALTKRLIKIEKNLLIQKENSIQNTQIPSIKKDSLENPLLEKNLHKASDEASFLSNDSKENSSNNFFSKNLLSQQSDKKNIVENHSNTSLEELVKLPFEISEVENSEQNKDNEEGVSRQTQSPITKKFTNESNIQKHIYKKEEITTVKKPETTDIQKSKTHHDTLMNFASAEFENVLKKE